MDEGLTITSERVDDIPLLLAQKEELMSQELIDAFTDMREQDVLKITDQMLGSGTDPLEALEACRKAMEVIGQRFEDGDCFLPELILAGEMLRQVSDKVKPRLQQEVKTKKIGKVIMGTVEGDIHDIGKDIVIFMLDVNGFEVMDLGVNVPVARFIEAAKEFEPQVIGLSGFLTLAFDPMKATVEALKEAGLRDSIKVMIGGGQIDDQVRKYTGADAYGRDAVAAVTLAKQWVGEE
jgi:5-methyltetrahydrofolate--homocysteine methyltransferase